MRQLGSLLILALGLFSARSLQAAPELPLVEDADFSQVKANCERLLKALDELKCPLPSDTERTLKDLLKSGARDDEVIAKIQRLLDAHCLIGVTINPESRVKAARGPAGAELTRGAANYRLIKVQNNAGVTQALTVTQAPTERWLDAAIHGKPPTLSGHELEYVLIRLTTQETGKREATLLFDVGQGTQDLGFRAEVPILFGIK
jgi:hypothetical protein